MRRSGRDEHDSPLHAGINESSLIRNATGRFIRAHPRNPWLKTFRSDAAAAAPDPFAVPLDRVGALLVGARGRPQGTPLQETRILIFVLVDWLMSLRSERGNLLNRSG